MEIQYYITAFLRDFVRILSEMSPYLLLGFFFAGLLYAFIPRDRIDRYFNGKPLQSSVWASLFGIPLPLCSCGVIPTGMAFYKNGASKGGTISFLISTPQTGVDSMLATFSLMGLPFAILRPLAALITGITGGLITHVVTKNDATRPVVWQQARERTTFAHKVIDVFRYGFVAFIQDISKWLVIGLVLAAIISAMIPDDFFALFNMPPILQMVLILAVSVPLYICATGSIPLAAILIMKGISPGAAFVLLMAGPATNAATLTMVGKVLGKRSLFAYLSTIVAGAMLFGLLIDYVLPVQWFSVGADPHVGHHHSEHLMWWQIASGVVLMALIINGYIQKYWKMKDKGNVPLSNRSMEIKTMKVEGMTCNHCKANVETHLEKSGLVQRATVHLASKTVSLEGENVDLEKAKEIIQSLGYTVV